MRYKDIVAHFGHHDQIHRGSGVGGEKMAARWRAGWIGRRIKMGFRAISDTYTTQTERVRTFCWPGFVPPFTYFLVFAALPILFLLFFFFFLYSLLPRGPLYPDFPPVLLLSCLLNVLESPFSSLSPSWCPRVVGTCAKKGDGSTGGPSYIASSGQMTIAIPFWNTIASVSCPEVKSSDRCVCLYVF